MKFSVFSVIALAASAIAAPVIKKADASDCAPWGYATMNGGTTGGSGGKTVKVSTLAELKSAASAPGKSIIIITESISGAEVVRVSSDKTILGADDSVVLTGVGLRILSVKNVIVRNLTIKKVLATSGDALAIQKATNVWIDHVDLSSDQDNGKDYYDGLLDMSHAADFVTVSYSHLHDHFKASLVGHADENGPEDIGHLRVTYGYNLFTHLNSRGPSFRFGTGHIFNNYYDQMSDGIDTRKGAQLLVENNVFVGAKKPLYSVDDGYAVARGNDFGGDYQPSINGTFTKAAYSYPLVDASSTKGCVVGVAGATLKF